MHTTFLSFSNRHRAFQVLFVLIALTLLAFLAARARAEQSLSRINSQADFSDFLSVEDPFKDAEQVFSNIEEQFNAIANPNDQPQDSTTVIEDGNTTTTIEQKSDPNNGSSSTVIESNTSYSDNSSATIHQDDSGKVIVSGDEDMKVTNNGDTTTIQGPNLEVNVTNQDTDPTADTDTRIRTRSRVRIDSDTDHSEDTNFSYKFSSD